VKVLATDTPDEEEDIEKEGDSIGTVTGIHTHYPGDHHVPTLDHHLVTEREEENTVEKEGEAVVLPAGPTAIAEVDEQEGEPLPFYIF
jgi:hypothetical protein